MPNYCDNSVSITAPRKTLDLIRSFVSGEDNVFDFGRIIPMPAGIYTGNLGSKEEEIYGRANWYDWCNRRWNTKWNSWDVDIELDEENNTLSYSFYTAWSSCEPVIEELAHIFPEAKIHYRYSEPGMCFCGEREYENGKRVYRMDGDFYEHWFDPEDPDDERCEPGESYSEEDQGCGIYSFSYCDADDERVIKIDGSYIDTRSVRPAFCW